MSEVPSAKPVSASRVTRAQLMQPEHANNQGNVHGGVVMKLVDEAGALACMRHAQRRVVTVAVDQMTFSQPIRVGDLVTLTAEVSYAGRTSIEAEVQVTAENPISGECTHTNTAYIVDVALDEEGNQQLCRRLSQRPKRVRRMEAAKLARPIAWLKTAPERCCQNQRQMTMDSEISSTPAQNPEPGESGSSVRSLRELIDRVSGKGYRAEQGQEDAGLAEDLPFPFLALVGQREMKLALLISLINPAVGGVLLVGSRGTGKTTAVRSLVDLLPLVPRSLCFYGCLPEDVETGGIDAICPDCARKYAGGEPLAQPDRAARSSCPSMPVWRTWSVGSTSRAATHERLRLRRGILAQSDRNLLYVDDLISAAR